jgi:hypothetical protein
MTPVFILRGTMMSQCIPDSAVDITPDGGRFWLRLKVRSTFLNLLLLIRRGPIMSSTSPKITSKAFLIHLPLRLSSQPIHITITQLLPSKSLLLHVTATRSPRLSDILVLSMPRGNDVLSSRLEGLGGLDEDIERLSRLLGPWMR